MIIRNEHLFTAGSFLPWPHPPTSISSVQFSHSVTSVFSNTTVQKHQFYRAHQYNNIQTNGLRPAPSWAWERQAPGCAKEGFPVSDGHLSTVFCHIPGATLFGPTEPGEHQGSTKLQLSSPPPITCEQQWPPPPVQVPIPRLPCQWSGP